MKIRLFLLCLAVGAPSLVLAYPTDEYERTKIRRLENQRGVDFKGFRGRKTVPGGRWPGDAIKLRMTKAGKDFDLTPETPKHEALQSGLEDILKKWSWRRYNVAILDITDPAKPRFAGVNETVQQTPGSVAKVLVASGLYEMLRQRYPNDIAKREELLRTHMIKADDWSKTDSHEVPVISGDEFEWARYRKIKTGDEFSLWEWIDHALSVSNNSAASTVWREATLMHLMGKDYPPEKYDAALFKQWDREKMTEASFEVVDKPLRDAGVDVENFFLRLYFTRGANRYIKSDTSRTTPLAILQWMVRMEQGRLVDAWSSMELKKMLYLTRRRVRYLYTDKLDPYFALFKSGSLYRFSEKAERIQYQGDIVNVLNSLIEIDTSAVPPRPEDEPPPEAKKAEEKKAEPKEEKKVEAAQEEEEKPFDPFAPGITDDKGRPFVYLVAVMSNELKRNAATDHARLAEAIHELVVTAPR